MKKSKKKIYVAGAGGMLGEAIFNTFKKKYHLSLIDKVKSEKWIKKLNFNNQRYEQDVKKFNPDYLFHIGALTDLEYCEKNRKEAYLTNYKSVKTATKICLDLNIPLIFISTAGIFDGKKNFYTEKDLPNPISYYAKTKFLSEIYIQKKLKKYFIIRPGWMMGGGLAKDKKFINIIMKQILAGKKELFVVNDKFGTPTYTYDLAKNLQILIEKNKYGLFHMVCEGLTSRLEVCKTIIKYLKLNNKIKITEVDSNFFKKKYFAKRPLSERLINFKLNKIKLNFMRSWEKSLKEYLKKSFI